MEIQTQILNGLQYVSVDDRKGFVAAWVQQRITHFDIIEASKIVEQEKDIGEVIEENNQEVYYWEVNWPRFFSNR